MANLSKNPEEYKERRTQLIALSNIAKKLRAATGAEEQTLNYFIVNMYQDSKPGEFKTFQEWKRLNKTIKKGEKGFPIWGQPVKGNRKTAANKSEEDTEQEYFPMCYLFHESQVAEMQRKEATA